MSNFIHSSDPRRSLAVPMLFSTLEPELRDRLIAANPARSYSDGQFIQHRGSKADGFWLIDEGNVRIGQHLADGEFRALAVLGPGDSYGELAVFAGSPRVVDALSKGASRVRFIPAAPFLEALASYPVSSRALLGTLSAQLQDILDQFADLRRGNTAARLAELLTNLSGTDHQVMATQQELAELLGVTRATANAALRTLEDLQLIERGYGTIKVRDPLALSHFVHG